VETHNHLFLICSLAKQIWRKYFDWIGNDVTCWGSERWWRISLLQFTFERDKCGEKIRDWFRIYTI